jgi:hypothetical protein
MTRLHAYFSFLYVLHEDTGILPYPVSVLARFNFVTQGENRSGSTDILNADA